MRVYRLPLRPQLGADWLEDPTWEPWHPRADILRAPDGWLIKLELAGVRPEEVRMAIEGNQMYVSGVRRDSTLDQGLSYYSLEMSYSRFERVLEFPCRIDASEVATDYRDGILYVKLTCSE